jgi:cell division protein FtsN
VFSYYYSLGFYKKAESYLDKLKKSFPESEYLKLSDRTIPDIDSFDAASLTDKLSEKPIVSEPVKGARYSIQAGAFLNIENAKKMSHQLSSDGFDVSLSTKEIGGSIFNIVLVGKFSAIEETEKILNALESKHNITGRVIDFEKQ